MQKYNISDVSFTFQSYLQLDGQEISPHFSSPIKESRGIESRRAVLNTGELIQTLFPVKDGVELEVSFQNTSASPVGSLCPIQNR